MPTSRPRYQITETPEVARPGRRREALAGGASLEAAPSLVHTGEKDLAKAEDDLVRRRREAVELTSNKYAEAFPDDYLSELHQDWPA